MVDDEKKKKNHCYAMLNKQRYGTICLSMRINKPFKTNYQFDFTER